MFILRSIYVFQHIFVAYSITGSRLQSRRKKTGNRTICFNRDSAHKKERCKNHRVLHVSMASEKRSGNKLLESGQQLKKRIVLALPTHVRGKVRPLPLHVQNTFLGCCFIIEIKKSTTDRRKQLQCLFVAVHLSPLEAVPVRTPFDCCLIVVENIVCCR